MASDGAQWRLLALGLAVTAGACAQGSNSDPTSPGFPSAPANPPIEGMLSEGGVECPAMRGSDGTLYTLIGDLDGFEIGDRICIVPSYVEMSFCMQGTTVHVDWIGPAPCPTE